MWTRNTTFDGNIKINYLCNMMLSTYTIEPFMFSTYVDMDNVFCLMTYSLN